ncbi:MAG: hypothetical protein L3J13_09600 [Devosiaceae bacterium]|nr:hypothetical protein [Devosiaceae bacterium]
MSKLSSEQQELKSSITKSAAIWGGVLGLIAGAITFWSTGDMDTGDRTQITGMVTGGAGFLIFWLISRSKAKSSKCPKCSATFSISRTNREETLVSSEEKSEHEKLEGGGSKLTKWTEEKFDVVETYTCSSCGDVTTKISQTTRRKDEVVKEKAAPSGDGDDVRVAGLVGGSLSGDLKAKGEGADNTAAGEENLDEVVSEKPVSSKSVAKAKKAKSAAKAAVKESATTAKDK